MKSRRTRTAQVQLETLLLVGLVSAAGIVPLTYLGTASETAIAGDATSTDNATPQHGTAMALAQQAGLQGLAARVAESGSAVEWVKTVPRRIATRIADFRPETDPLLRGDFIPAWKEIDLTTAEASLTRAIEKADRRIARVASPWRLHSPNGVTKALGNADREADFAGNVLHNLNAMTDSPELRAAYQRMDELTSAFASRVASNEGIWATLQRMEKSPRSRLLRGEDKRVFEQTMAGWRRSGADLPVATKARLTDIDTRLSELSRKYSNNVTEGQKRLELYVDDAAKLDGLPQDYVDRARAGAEAAGKPGYRISFFDGTMDEAFERVHDAGVREAIYRLQRGVASSGDSNNAPLATEILTLRREKAQILGFNDYSDLATETRMVKNGATAEAFIDDLIARTTGYYEEELKGIRAFRKSVDGGTDLQPWDEMYWWRSWSDTLVSSDVVKAYFPVDQVLSGFFTTAKELYGIDIAEVKAAGWNDEVRTFTVTDTDGSHLGTFQMDLYAREGKSSGAWHQGLNVGLGDDPTFSAVITNFEPPAGGKPTLLTVREVETVFHEFGHTLHAMFSKAKRSDLAGTRVARDFVEFPSQIMENFVWEDEVLSFLAKHHETGEALPAELLKSLQAKRSFGAARVQMRQLAYAKLDLALHRHYDPAVHGDVADYAAKVVSDMLPANAPKTWGNVNNFKHIFSGGYASGYYGYKWAEVLDADGFARFADDGVLSRRVGQSLRDEVLSKGDTADADVLYRNYMGRNPVPDALQRRNGFNE